MTTDQVRSEILKQGFQVDEERLLDWARAKVIPSQVSVNGQEEWPSEAWWQASIACYLMDQEGWTVPEVQVARFHMGKTLTCGDNPLDKLDWFFSANAGGIKGFEEQYVDAFAWAVAAIKAQSRDIPLGATVEITVTSTQSGKRQYEINSRDLTHQHAEKSRIEYRFERSLKDVIKDETGRSHPRPVEPPAAEIIG